jgi:hypothetical protein
MNDKNGCYSPFSIHLYGKLISFLFSLMVSISQKAFLVNCSITTSFTEVCIDEIVWMIKYDDRCDRMNSILCVSLTGKYDVIR